MKIIDNALGKEEFGQIRKLLTSWDFPWYYQYLINGNQKKEDLNCYFTHRIYETGRHYSTFYGHIKPLIDFLKPKALIRVKCNIYPRTGTIETHAPHSDYPYKHKGAILYINTCNGYTLLHDGTKVESIENRLLLFNSQKPHSSTSTTNAKARININVNYF